MTSAEERHSIKERENYVHEPGDGRIGNCEEKEALEHCTGAKEETKKGVRRSRVTQWSLVEGTVRGWKKK